MSRRVEETGIQEKILTACLAPCVHVAGTLNFGNIAASRGFQVTFLGPAKTVEEIIAGIVKLHPDIVGLSYRLTPANLKPVLDEFFAQYDRLDPKPARLYFAGTPPVVAVAKEFPQFDHFFEGGESPNKILRILNNDESLGPDNVTYPKDLITRIQWKKPFPLLRAHFGLPSLQDTLAGISELATADVLDVISIAPDQEAQENFFHPSRQKQSLAGAGGVPLRTRSDLVALHDARQKGNYPLLRIYAGTQDFIRFAELTQETFQNAWAAIPIFWFNKMDGRGPLSLEESIQQHLDAIRWHARRGIPVEINDPHHWGLRDAPDSIVVADSFLCARIAKKLGVRHYVAQYMFNSPPNASLKMDLAKMLAMQELNQSLEDESFTIIREVRTGLASMPLQLDRAKGQLALATAYQLALHPHIVHVVTHSEALHAASPREIIESCEVVNQIILRNLDGLPDPTADPDVIRRKDQILQDVQLIFQAIDRLAKTLLLRDDEPPYVQKILLNKIVTSGLFDAPHLVNNAYAQGKIHSKILNGACVTYDPEREQVVSEEERIEKIISELSAGLRGRVIPAAAPCSRGGARR